MNTIPEDRYAIVYGPKGCGKTTNAQRLLLVTGMNTVIDDWDFGPMTITPGALHLSYKLPPKAHRHSSIPFDQAMELFWLKVQAGELVDPLENSVEELPLQTQMQIATLGATAMWINDLASDIHLLNHKWWHDLKTGEPLQRNRGELLMLIVSEVAEAMEGERKSLMDDKLPHRPMAEVELADALIRIFDYAKGFGYDLGGAVVEKLQYNTTRHDHTAEARLAEGGKKW